MEAVRAPRDPMHGLGKKSSYRRLRREPATPHAQHPLRNSARKCIPGKVAASTVRCRLLKPKAPDRKAVGCYKARIDADTAPRTFDTDALLDVECGVVSNHGHSRGFLRALIASHQDFAMAEAPWDPRCDRLAAVNCAAGIPFARGRFFKSNCSQPATEEFVLAICPS